jgi:hypothetical protein
MKILLFTLLITTASCATRGKEFSSDLSWIKKEITKKEDVKLVLGDPFEVGYSSGQPTWTYGLYQYRLFGDTHTKELKLYWSRNGVIERYSFSSSFPQDVNRAESSLNQGSQVAPK